jgi:hypothetical protein
VFFFSPQTWKILFIFVTPTSYIEYAQCYVCVRDFHFKHNHTIFVMSVIKAEMFVIKFSILVEIFDLSRDIQGTSSV